MTEFIKNFPMLERKTSTAASITRQFLTGLREYILEKRLAQVEKLVRAAKADVPRGSLVHDMDNATIVEITLERVLFAALESRLVACFPRQEQQERLEKYRRNRTQLIKKDQGYFDIEVCAIPVFPSPWFLRAIDKHSFTSTTEGETMS